MVTEVQDQRQIEIELLLTLVRDPCGIHFGTILVDFISIEGLCIVLFSWGYGTVHLQRRSLSVRKREGTILYQVQGQVS
jgi:hypothetical protein